MQTIIDFFLNIVDWCLSIFSKCWEWLLDTCAVGINALLSPLADALPDLSSAWDNLSVIAPYVNFVDKWIAIKYGFVLLAAYFTFIFVMITVKLVIKLFVPTLG